MKQFIEFDTINVRITINSDAIESLIEDKIDKTKHQILTRNNILYDISRQEYFRLYKILAEFP